MLRLCPEDNMGVRSYLPVYLLGLSRYLDCLNFTVRAHFFLSIFPPRSDSLDLLSIVVIQFNWLSSDNPPQGGTILASRSTNDFDVHLTAKSSKTKTAINRSIDGEGVHSAAFAAFMVFGDVELSRELLRKSVSLNPHILCRILAGTPRPGMFFGLSSLSFVSVVLSSTRNLTTPFAFISRARRLQPHAENAQRCAGW
jgi:hypothetical protein